MTVEDEGGGDIGRAVGGADAGDDRGGAGDVGGQAGGLAQGVVARFRAAELQVQSGHGNVVANASAGKGGGSAAGVEADRGTVGGQDPDEVRATGVQGRGRAAVVGLVVGDDARHSQAGLGDREGQGGAAGAGAVGGGDRDREGAGDGRRARDNSRAEVDDQAVGQGAGAVASGRIARGDVDGRDRAAIGAAGGQGIGGVGDDWLPPGGRKPRGRLDGRHAVNGDGKIDGLARIDVGLGDYLRRGCVDIIEAG